MKEFTKEEVAEAWEKFEKDGKRMPTHLSTSLKWREELTTEERQKLKTQTEAIFLMSKGYL